MRVLYIDIISTVTMELIQFKHPEEKMKKVVMLGEGAGAAHSAVEVMEKLNLIK